jgi:hypothetical protein
MKENLESYLSLYFCSLKHIYIVTCGKKEEELGKLCPLQQIHEPDTVYILLPSAHIEQLFILEA